ncbi:hypothetical protein L0F63_006549 [Massospora cicadina]|nr:hypothetical protein L0F63_006549 [Massospora cicadina]
MKGVKILLLGIFWIGKLLSEDGFTPNLKTRADLIEWKQKVNLAVRELIQANRTSRSFMNEDSLRMVISGIFANAKGSMKCEACVVGVKASTRVARIPGGKGPMLATFKKVCSVIKLPRSVCQGIVSSSGPVVYDILANIKSSPEILQMTCFAFGNSCPMPNLSLRPIHLPPPVSTYPQRVRSGKSKFILHLSDLHYDRDYLEGAEADCNKPICCQKDSNSDEGNPYSVRKPAHFWGDYRCDINKPLLLSLLEGAHKEHISSNLDMAIFTGDVPAHDMWKEEEGRAMVTESSAYRHIASIFHDGPSIYPVIGNHEAVPVNQFPLMHGMGYSQYFLYKFIAKEWERWLPHQATSLVSRVGFYSVEHSSNLKVISLNNNLCYTLNFYLLLNPYDGDPNGMLKWLVAELQEAEARHMRVYILSHVPPGGTDCYRHWSDQFYAIVQRYHKVIAAQFYGHTHFDEFQLFYSDDIKSSNTAISTGETYEVMDFTQYYTNLAAKETWPITGPTWEPLYTAKQTYGRGLADPNFPINATFWHKVTEAFITDINLFNTFYNLRTKMGLPQPSCNDDCRKAFICTLKAGRSRDSCAEIDPFS